MAGLRRSRGQAIDQGDSSEFGYTPMGSIVFDTDCKPGRRVLRCDRRGNRSRRGFDMSVAHGTSRAVPMRRASRPPPRNAASAPTARADACCAGREAARVLGRSQQEPCVRTSDRHRSRDGQTGRNSCWRNASWVHSFRQRRCRHLVRRCAFRSASRLRQLVAGCGRGAAASDLAIAECDVGRSGVRARAKYDYVDAVDGLEPVSALRRRRSTGLGGACLKNRCRRYTCCRQGCALTLVRVVVVFVSCISGIVQ